MQAFGCSYLMCNTEDQRADRDGKHRAQLRITLSRAGSPLPETSPCSFLSPFFHLPLHLLHPPLSSPSSPPLIPLPPFHLSTSPFHPSPLCLPTCNNAHYHLSSYCLSQMKTLVFQETPSSVSLHSPSPFPVFLPSSLRLFSSPLSQFPVSLSPSSLSPSPSICPPLLLSVSLSPSLLLESP